jgi:hypothetical protein
MHAALIAADVDLRLINAVIDIVTIAGLDTILVIEAANIIHESVCLCWPVAPWLPTLIAPHVVNDA